MEPRRTPLADTRTSEVQNAEPYSTPSLSVIRVTLHSRLPFLPGDRVGWTPCATTLLIPTIESYARSCLVWPNYIRPWTWEFSLSHFFLSLSLFSSLITLREKWRILTDLLRKFWLGIFNPLTARLLNALSSPASPPSARVSLFIYFRFSLFFHFFFRKNIAPDGQLLLLQHTFIM